MTERLQQVLLESPVLRPVLERWEQVALPDCWVVAGAVFQTFWNEVHGLPPAHGIRDVDLVYFDDSDLSEEAEAAHAARIAGVFADCPVLFDVKNEARVHLWYAEKFGYAIRPYVSIWDAIATFPTTAGAVGIRPGPEGLEYCAPFGTDDLVQLIVRPNKAQITEEIYVAKIDRWRALWPRLTIIDWDAAA